MPDKPASRRRTKPAANRPVPKLTEVAALGLLENGAAPAADITLDEDTRRQLIAAEAYFIAERRGFTSGHEFDDWIEAEHVVDARLRELHAA